ncbi:MAG: ribonuclease H-like domain-containing protein, partial [Lachnospiraceae bacterium]|nr:ribonuclease H-like domain-containing protein [Lachnospiraceae bacterium]
MLKDTMITVTDTFESARFYDLEHELNKKYENKKAAYFDIETTGFSSKSQQIYLIGAAYKNEDSDTFTVIQWFDDTSHDECKLLLMFREFLKDFDILVDYNGNSFDIPFIKNRGIKHGILFNFDKFVLIDLYLEIKKYRGFLKTPDLKQKSIELFLNINREDEYDGGRLIEIYKDYIKEPSKSKNLLSLLMLHNHDDIIG